MTDLGLVGMMKGPDRDLLEGVAMVVVIEKTAMMTVVMRGVRDVEIGMKNGTMIIHQWYALTCNLLRTAIMFPDFALLEGAKWKFVSLVGSVSHTCCEGSITEDK